MQDRRIKLDFNRQNILLSGILETPADAIKAYVIFAHCFTCGKDFAAAARIARALVAEKYAVLRFDFTGLGASAGDFSDTNFSTNVSDLIAAADFLRAQYQAPSLLIGHSFGGTAALSAAHHIPECQGIITIGSPANASHITTHFGETIATIATEGEAEIDVAGRKYTLKKQFLDNINKHSVNHLADLHIPLLILHSPNDETVAIKEAEKIYRVANHPKSFISLDTADHILSNRTDVEYVVSSITAWASKFLHPTKAINQAQLELGHGEIRVQEYNQQLARNVFSDDHFWLTGEPVKFGGDNLGPDPYEQLLSALGTCTSITLRQYANCQNWPLDDIVIELKHRQQHGQDSQDCEQGLVKISQIERRIIFKGDLSEAQKLQLVEIAERCPVQQTLQNNIIIETTVVHD